MIGGIVSRPNTEEFCCGYDRVFRKDAAEQAVGEQLNKQALPTIREIPGGAEVVFPDGRVVTCESWKQALQLAGFSDDGGENA